MLPRSVRIFAYQNPVDMRKSFDALSGLVQTEFHKRPDDGALYVFVNKRRNRAKVLWWDRNGFCVLYKRLSGATFLLPDGRPTQSILSLDDVALAKLFRGIDKKRKRMKKTVDTDHHFR